MLNTMKVALTGAMAVAAFASTSAQAATGTADATATIISAVQLTQNDVLDFGVVASSTTAGTVDLPTDSNTRTCSVGVTCVGTALRGQFTVSGAATGYTVGIVVPATAILTSNGVTMSTTLTPSMTTFVSNGGARAIFVGGTLSVGANQAAGLYTGTYTVSANYQ